MLLCVYMCESYIIYAEEEIIDINSPHFLLSLQCFVLLVPFLFNFFEQCDGEKVEENRNDFLIFIFKAMQTFFKQASKKILPHHKIYEHIVTRSNE